MNYNMELGVKPSRLNRTLFFISMLFYVSCIFIGVCDIAFEQYSWWLSGGFIGYGTIRMLFAIKGFIHANRSNHTSGR